MTCAWCPAPATTTVQTRPASYGTVTRQDQHGIREVSVQTRAPQMTPACAACAERVITDVARPPVTGGDQLSIYDQLDTTEAA